MEMSDTEKKKRLTVAGMYVRQGAVFADIGTDHAHLPISLLEAGRITRAYACDIAEGPLARAKANVAEAGLSHAVTFRLTDGLCGLETEGITDAAICGMGGEMIVSILENAPFCRDPRMRLILQPMSRGNVLRAYLAKEGFRVAEEALVREGSHFYSCMAAEFCGVPYALDPLQLQIGQLTPKTEAERRDLLALLGHIAAVTQRKLSGMAQGSAASAPTAEIAEGRELLRLCEERKNALLACSGRACADVPAQ